MKIRPGKTHTGTGLSATLAIAFFSFSLVVLLISIGLQIYSNFRSYQQNLTGQQQLVAQEAAVSVSNFIQGQLSVLKTTATLTNPAKVTEQARIESLNSLLGQEPAFRQVALLDAQYQQVATVSRLSKVASGNAMKQLSAEGVAQINKEERYISPIYIDKNTSEPLIIMAVPVKNVFGDAQGVLMAEVNLKYMWDLVDQITIGQTGYAYVVNEKGDLIAYRDTGRVLLGENLKNIFKVNQFVSNPYAEAKSIAETFTGINGTQVVGTYIPLGTPAWAVVTELPVAEAFQPLIQQIILAVFVVIALAIIAGLVGLFVARRLSVPLVDLAKTADRISAGEINLQAEVEGPTEVASLAVSFNSMTSELRQLLSNLEQRVADRTRALSISADVSRRLSTILETNQLVKEVVEQLQSAFNYYHVHIYLFNDARDELLMAGGTGEVGQILLSQGHKIPKGKGLVGRAAETQMAVLVSDVSRVPDWLPNPLLPETKAEAAVPIAIGENVLGVLDVQQNQVGGLQQVDVELLQSIANQVAIALQNARTYAQVQHQASREALITAIGQRIQHTTSPEEALQIAVREVGRAVGAERTTIKLNITPGAGDEKNN